MFSATQRQNRVHFGVWFSLLHRLHSPCEDLSNGVHSLIAATVLELRMLKVACLY